MEQLLGTRALLLVALLFPEEDRLSSVSGRILNSRGQLHRDRTPSAVSTQGCAGPGMQAREALRAPGHPGMRPSDLEPMTLRGFTTQESATLCHSPPRWWTMEQVSKLSTAGKAKAFVKNIVTIWKYKWATALKERMPAVYLRTEAADPEARGPPPAVLLGQSQDPGAGHLGKDLSREELSIVTGPGSLNMLL